MRDHLKFKRHFCISSFIPEHHDEIGIPRAYLQSSNMGEVVAQPAAIYLPMNLRSGTPKLGES